MPQDHKRSHPSAGGSDEQSKCSRLEEAKQFATIGVVGAGNMGRGMAASLARKHRVVQFDMNRAMLLASAAQSEAIEAADNFEDMCRKVDCVVVSVAGEKAERAVIESLVAHAAPSSLIIGCGTVTVSLARELHSKAEARQLKYLDAPVSGGPEGAAKGTLSIMVGGSQAVFAEACVVFEAMGGYWVRMGGPGAGAAAKLVNQLLTASNALSATEALAFARRVGMDTPESLGALMQLLERSWGNSTMLQRTGGIVREALSKGAALEVDAAAPLRNFAKDLDFVLAAAGDAGLNLAATQAARAVVWRAEGLGLDGADWAVVSQMHAAPPPVPRAAAPETKQRVFSSLAELTASVPAPLPLEALLLQCARLAGRRAPLAVIDDDPTGTQTVHSVPVLGDWSVETLVDALSSDIPCFYVLANTRALKAEDAVARAEEIAVNLRKAALRLGLDPRDLGVVSRSDSTLRGHYPAETDALVRGLQWGEPVVLLAPFFFEGGRLTAHDVHYVKGPDDTLTPAGETEFARDRAFGYKASHLPTWVREKAGDKTVVSLSLDLIRGGGPEAVAGVVAGAAAGTVIVANALVPSDMASVAAGCMLAERRGKALLYRSAGALVAARAALPPRPLLVPAELAKPGAVGLVVVGSYVGKSSAQLAEMLRLCPWAHPVELSVRALVAGDDGEAPRAQAAIDGAMRGGRSVVLYTSREVIQDDGAGGLSIGAKVNSELCGIVRKLAVNGTLSGAFLIAKGGITSNDIAVESLGVKKATVLGCVRPGVPVWRLGPETRAPGLAYVVFPGNVGAVDDLAKAAAIMSGRRLGGLADVLREARRAGRAVGAFNVYNIEGALAVQQAVERVNLPAILQVHPASLKFGGTALLAACLDISARNPLIHVLLDHASDELSIRLSLDAGVHGVMADGSHLDFAANLTWTAKMAESAHAKGAMVEAELGRLAGEEDGLAVELRDAKMTDPAVVADFLAATKVDVLAVTIGNVHGKYSEDPPVLDWPRLDAIRASAGDTPLALHGASGLPDHMLRAAIRAGICKLNVNTEVRAAARQAARDSASLDLLDAMVAGRDAMAAVVEAKMRTFANIDEK